MIGTMPTFDAWPGLRSRRDELIIKVVPGSLVQDATGRLQRLPLGEWLFACVAAGLINYRIFCEVRAVYGKIPERRWRLRGYLTT